MGSFLFVKTGPKKGMLESPDSSLGSKQSGYWMGPSFGENCSMVWTLLSTILGCEKYWEATIFLPPIGVSGVGQTISIHKQPMFLFVPRAIGCERLTDDMDVLLWMCFAFEFICASMLPCAFFNGCVCHSVQRSRGPKYSRWVVVLLNHRNWLAAIFAAAVPAAFAARFRWIQTQRTNNLDRLSLNHRKGPTVNSWVNNVKVMGSWCQLFWKRVRRIAAKH